ncbi:igLON family member 5 [Eurytemora carolleeae]|uniref:igLON family member 5 n=1 Tax=Eurytemora carolleeae TaxID=1294199 RepID=UPI000C7818F8|nr:igLON family member 5 [Eurytemora carolleeae]|eukprot:XP_023322105.1 igLON family member 5-like [Eurytemora affinis]
MSAVMGPWISRLLFIGPWIIILSNLVEKGECDTPEFIYPIDNITVAAGRDAHFTCVVNKLQGHKVAWLRSDSKAILAIHNHMVTNNHRMTVSHNGHNTWRLHISNVQRNDSGHYMCQINTEPMVSQIGMLEVVEAPDILYNETSNDTITMESANVNLICEARGYPEPTVIWKREDKENIVLRDGTGGVHRVSSVEGRELSLTKLTRGDSGAYLCIASNGVPSPVSKRIMLHVHFHPTVDVVNQIVSAAVGTQVILECVVQSSPRPINYWAKQMQKGEDVNILSGGRYKTTEEQINSYSMRIYLTIDVRKKDFGVYACKARNSLGEAQATVQLQESKIELSAPDPDFELETTTLLPVQRIKKRRKGKERRKNKVEEYDDWEEEEEEEGGDQSKPQIIFFKEPEIPATVYTTQTISSLDTYSSNTRNSCITGL